MPSGNFGNVCAGHIARMMGLPIRKLIVATNENDVLDEFFRTGRYKGAARPTPGKPPARRWTSPRPPTSSALFSIWSAATPNRCALWQAVDSTGRFDLSASPLFAKISAGIRLCSGKAPADRLATIRHTIPEQYGGSSTPTPPTA